MNKTVVSLAVLLVGLALAKPAFPMGSVYSPGVPMEQQADWPAGVADLLNCPNRVLGYVGGQINVHWCFFAGDAQDFNDFIERYARLEGISHKVVLNPGRGESLSFEGRPGLFDWQISVCPNVRDLNGVLELWVDGQVELDKVIVPSNVQVVAAGTNEDIAKFIAEIESRRAEKEKPERRLPQTRPEPKSGAPFKSSRVLYGKVALTQDASRLLSVALDESGGTRTGYDVLYADTNFDGRFDESEKFAADAVNRQGSWLASSSFPVIALGVPFNENSRKTPDSCRITIGYLQYPRHGVAEEISVGARFKLDGSDTEWEFAFGGGVRPAKSLEKASVWRVGEKPTLEVFARPDGYVKGNLGLGLTFAAGQNKLECWKGGQPVKAQAIIRKPDGEVVHRGEATPDKFSFG